MPSKKEEDDKIRELLIEKVSQHRAIWDTANPNHLKTGTVIANDWHEILKEMEEAFGRELLEKHGAITVPQLKNIWQNLRSQFRKCKTGTKGKSGAAASDVELVPRWKFYQQMLFLEKAAVMLPTHDTLTLVGILIHMQCNYYYWNYNYPIAIQELPAAAAGTTNETHLADGIVLDDGQVLLDGTHIGEVVISPPASVQGLESTNAGHGEADNTQV